MPPRRTAPSHAKTSPRGLIAPHATTPSHAIPPPLIITPFTANSLHVLPFSKSPIVFTCFSGHHLSPFLTLVRLFGASPPPLRVRFRGELLLPTISSSSRRHLYVSLLLPPFFGIQLSLVFARCSGVFHGISHISLFSFFRQFFGAFLPYIITYS